MAIHGQIHLPHQLAASDTLGLQRSRQLGQVWLDTSDDWIGTTDRAHKVKGAARRGKSSRGMSRNAGGSAEVEQGEKEQLEK